jgi:hypothetical protein
MNRYRYFLRPTEPPVGTASYVVSTVCSGTASSSDVYAVNVYSYPHVSPNSALRSDWEKVGGYFATAIDAAKKEPVGE